MTAGSPRLFERVPAGTKFDIEIILQIFENDNEKTLTQTIRDCLEYIEDSYIGGSGSRGYGQVEIVNLKVEEKEF